MIGKPVSGILLALLMLGLFLLTFSTYASYEEPSSPSITLSDQSTSLYFDGMTQEPYAWCGQPGVPGLGTGIGSLDFWSLRVETSYDAIIEIKWGDHYYSGDVYEIYIDGVWVGANPVGSAPWGKHVPGNNLGVITVILKTGLTHNVKVKWASYDPYSGIDPSNGSYYDIWFTVIGQNPPSFVAASIDFDPATLNLKSMGNWITAYSQLPERYSPADINASTILLNGTVTPVLDPTYDFVTNSSEYLVDHNNDGILERMVKFNRTAVEDFILSKDYKYGNVTLTVTGLLYDNTSFEGKDAVLIKMPGDVNSDGVVDGYDLMMVGKTFGAKAGQLLYDSNADFDLDGIIDDYELIIVGKNLGKTYQ